MSLLPYSVQLSAIDRERFEIVVARANGLQRKNLSQVLDFCHMHDVRMLIARCSTTDLETVHTLEQLDFRLMDTLIYYVRDLSKTPIPADASGHRVRPVLAKDTEQARTMVAAAFRGYLGHYHADPRLDRAKCDEVYPSWAVRAIESRGVKDEVLVVEQGGEILGLAVLHLNSPEEVDALLFAVAPQVQRQGVYRSLLIHCLQWSLSRGAQRLISSTQITNIASQKSWTRVGFEFDRAFYTFHKWFD